MKSWIPLGRLFLVFATLAAFATSVLSSTFEDDLKRVDSALRTNPSGALRQTLESCAKQRDFAVAMYRKGLAKDAMLSLQYCFDSLRISKTGPSANSLMPTREELTIKANRVYEEALALKPDLANGLAIYRQCAACHGPEGSGSKTGSIPQIAGQHAKVVIKQLADFRVGNRDSGLMTPYASAEIIGGAQGIANVAAYISSLKIDVANGQGSSGDLELGKSLYLEHCVKCHGESGQGSNDGLVPSLHAQHYRYLLRQFKWIRDGKRRNANAEMMAQIQQFDDGEMKAVLDYSSRLVPVENSRAPADWKNPDFN